MKILLNGRAGRTAPAWRGARGGRGARAASGLRAAVVAVLAVIASLAVATPALAHVSVDPHVATQSDFTRLAFRVPTESDTASTTKLEVFLPEDAPVASVSVMPVPGWTAKVERRQLDQPVPMEGGEVKEVVSKITWTAERGAEIKPGQFQEFPVSMGPLPNVDVMIFKAIQTYSDGTIVRWIDEPAANGTEAANPAPVLELRAAPGSAEPGGSDGSSGSAGGADDSSDTLPIWLAAAGLAAGLVGVAIGALAYARTRRSPGSA